MALVPLSNGDEFSVGRTVPRYVIVSRVSGEWGQYARQQTTVHQII